MDEIWSNMQAEAKAKREAEGAERRKAEQNDELSGAPEDKENDLLSSIEQQESLEH